MKKFKLPNLQEWFLQRRIVRKTLIWSKKSSLPGFGGIPVHDIVVFVLNEFKRYDLFTRANSTAYSFFLSLFPSLIALFTLIPYLKNYFIDYLPGGENFDVYLQESIFKIMPGIAGERLFTFIQDITNKPRFGFLSFSFILAIYFASNGMLALMRGFEKSYFEAFKQRNFLKKRLIATLLTFQLGLLLVGSVVLVILGNSIINFVSSYIQLDFLTKFSLNFFRWIAIFGLFYSGIAIIFRHGAPFKKKFRIFSPGTTVATILCIMVSVGFSYYVDQIKSTNELYGTIWTIIVLMIWIQLNSLILLIGFELNASIAVHLDSGTETSEAAT